jgi:hypothetical protein
MTIPFPPGGTPDQTVNTDPGAQLSQGIQVLVSRMGGLERVIAGQTAMLERTLSASNRFQMAGQPQFRQSILQEVVGAGASPAGAARTQVSPMGAMSSMENLRAFGAQRLGEWIAGVPLYENPGGGAGGPGATPVGTPTTVTVHAYVGGPAAPAAPGGPAPPGGPAGPPAGPGGPGGPAPAGPGGPAPGGPGPGGPAGPPAPGAPGGPPAPAGLPAFLFGAGRHGGGGGPVPTAVLRQAGARVALSSGSLSGIAGALKSIPGVGLIADAISGVADFFSNQREAGRVYQEIEGGSNLAAQTERLHSLAYQASMYGRMPSGAAAQSFGAVTAMGYNQAAAGEGQEGQNRQSALDFIYHNYTANGMDVNQSLQILQTASKNAVINLNDVSEALKTVSDTAGQAGSNANVMRQQFNNYFNAAQQLGAGAGSPALAGGIASMQASMGKEFAGVNFSGELSQARQYLLSGMSGLSPAQLQYTARNNPGQYNKLLAGQNLQFLVQGGLMTPEMQSSLQKMIGAVGGGQAMMADPGLRDQVAQQFLNEWQVKGNINENLWAQEISMLTGTPMNPDQAFQWIVSQSAGINEASHNSTLGPTGARTSGRISVPANRLGNAPQGRFGLAIPSTHVSPGVVSRYDTQSPSQFTTSWQNVLRQHGGAAASNYLKFDTQHGKTRNPVLEALLQNANPSDQVRVQTKNGPRVMPMSEAMKYYPQEIASGNVEFYSSSGQQLGGTAALTNGLVNTNANVSGEEKQSTGSKQGLSLSKYNTSHPGSATVPAGGGRSVTIDLSNAAQQLLKLLPNNYDQAAATSQVPSNPWPSQASR